MSVPYADIKVHGLEQLDRELRQLPDKLRRKALATGVGAGARLAVKLSKKKANALGLKDSGDMIKAIRAKRKKTGSRYAMIYGVGYFGKGWYGRLYEYGFDNSKGGRRYRPVIRATLDEHAKEIVHEITARMWEQLIKIQQSGAILKSRR